MRLPLLSITASVGAVYLAIRSISKLFHRNLKEQHVTSTQALSHPYNHAARRERSRHKFYPST